MSAVTAGGDWARLLEQYAPSSTRYVGRFAPSPTGVLHDGSLVAALASWLDARAHAGRWLVRIEDIDTSRNVPDAGRHILSQLSALGLHADATPEWQSVRSDFYGAALGHLDAHHFVYRCTCSRTDIARAIERSGLPRRRHGELVYPGTCRHGPVEPTPASDHASAALRLRTDGATVEWSDRRLGPQRQDVEAEVGDFVLRRRDGLFAYQLAVVVDDALQGITAVVRGEDLADNTARQIYLQSLLGVSPPLYLHTPLVLGADGHKLSKQNGAAPLDTSDPLATLSKAGCVLGLHLSGPTVSARLESGIAPWTAMYKLAS